MKIDLITCSDPREDTSPEKLVAFMNEFPNVEVAVQASTKQIGPGTARYAWFEEFFPLVRNNPVPLNLAMHVNKDYSSAMCLGVIPDPMINWFNARRTDGKYVIRRFQINGVGSLNRTFEVDSVCSMIFQNMEREFIMQYDSSYANLARIWNVAYRCAPFAVLFDESGGTETLPNKYTRPFLSNKTGYAGGLSPENISTQLDKIAAVADDATIWIDAEGGLKTPGTKTFDIARAREYVRAANIWNEKFGR